MEENKELKIMNAPGEEKEQKIIIEEGKIELNLGEVRTDTKTPIKKEGEEKSE